MARRKGRRGKRARLTGKYVRKMGLLSARARLNKGKVIVV